jgi:sulfonate transport system substrate-binding protein
MSDVISRRRFTGTIAAAAASASLLPGSRVRAADPNVVRIGYLPSLTPLNFGRLRGTLQAAVAPHGFTIQWLGPFPAFAPAVEALTPGSIDITVGSATSAASAMVAKAPFRIFQYAPPSANGEGVFVRNDSTITSVPGLIGKRVAVNRGGTGEYLLALALQKHGIAYDKVDRVYLGPADAAYAFSSGAVDGWAAWDPYLAVAEVRDRARVLALSHEIGSENATIVVARNAFIDQNPAIVKVIYDALIAENKWDNANVVASTNLWASDAKQDPGTAAVLAKRAPFIYGPVTPAVVASLTHVAQWFADQKIIPTVPDVSACVYDVSRG